MSKRKDEKTVLNDRFDLTGISNTRIMKHFLMTRLLPMGNYAGGPRLKPIILFLLISCAGRPLFFFTTRFERQMILFYKVLLRIKKA